MINAPNAIRNDLVLKPISVGKFSAYSDSNSDQGISWAIFTQRLSSDNLPSKGSSKSDGGLGASSAFRYTIANGDARVLSHYTCFSCTLTTFLVGTPIHCLLFSLIQQALFRNRIPVFGLKIIYNYNWVESIQKNLSLVEFEYIDRSCS